jgi:hypothetical protein
MEVKSVEAAIRARSGWCGDASGKLTSFPDVVAAGEDCTARTVFAKKAAALAALIAHLKPVGGVAMLAIDCEQVGADPALVLIEGKSTERIGTGAGIFAKVPAKRK